jgi:hypothetical protein
MTGAQQAASLTAVYGRVDMHPAGHSKSATLRAITAE